MAFATDAKTKVMKATNSFCYSLLVLRIVVADYLQALRGRVKYPGADPGTSLGSGLWSVSIAGPSGCSALRISQSTSVDISILRQL